MKQSVLFERVAQAAREFFCGGLLEVIPTDDPLSVDLLVATTGNSTHEELELCLPYLVERFTKNQVNATVVFAELTPVDPSAKMLVLTVTVTGERPANVRPLLN